MEQQSANKTILFLPFLQIPSGHHQVAKALMDGIQKNQPYIKCEKVDILSYSFGKVEALVSNTYLKWIHAFPGLYSRVYRSSVYKNVDEKKRFRLYEILFLRYMRKLLSEKKPDVIVCTHGLPSYMLNYLKEKKEISVPVINVYTDYFIHSVWGIQHIDYHFVPTNHMKDFLQQKGLKEGQIFLTGIPIHHKINKQADHSKPVAAFSPLSILITGGNLGVGAINDLVKKIGTNKSFHFYVLCGTNQALYQMITNLQKNNITPIGYIESREKMNELYDKMDAIVTKPGGVTISECLFKRKLIFIYHALPGQEEINVQMLEKSGLIFQLKQWKNDNQSLEDQLYPFFQSNTLLESYQDRINEYHHNIIEKIPSQIIEELLYARNL
ncbi:UDP-glucuronosyltransferase [Peribacillus cavernae]|uniref:UDP-glucuronosyltransferase n=1 Tax=Peribacillus cavernae TaxID=1674310 RepID=A0A3S0VTV1_9BACI|nr:glycosyltransferase [Peribacillus cavernae]MDQ0217864.1 UDP-N-acetylglucosamine:LPS N-acetylglucosamine transferase [Peribacillus cavernae]RUQ32531.1 UDP-glucuronosyltransferase [Peribacillus cavernae]